jgi:hypothetical protein
MPLFIDIISMYTNLAGTKSIYAAAEYKYTPHNTQLYCINSLICYLFVPNESLEKLFANKIKITESYT